MLGIDQPAYTDLLGCVFLTGLADDNTAGIHHASRDGGVDFRRPLYHRCPICAWYSSERDIVLQGDRSALEQIARRRCAFRSNLLRQSCPPYGACVNSYLCCPPPEIVVLGYVNISPWVLAEVRNGDDTAVFRQVGDYGFETADERDKIRGHLIR
jgi:hypothetical protein